MTYRGIPGMEVHLYRWGELQRDLAVGGLPDRRGPADRRVHARPIAAPWLLPGHPRRGLDRLRADGR